MHVKMSRTPGVAINGNAMSIYKHDSEEDVSSSDDGEGDKDDVDDAGLNLSSMTTRSYTSSTLLECLWSSNPNGALEALYLH